MNDNKNRKSNEALPDETQTGKVLPDETQTGEALPDDALENVAGGGWWIGSRSCSRRNKPCGWRREH